MTLHCEKHRVYINVAPLPEVCHQCEVERLQAEVDRLTAENEQFRTLEEKACTTVYMDLREELGLVAEQSLFDEVTRMAREHKEGIDLIEALAEALRDEISIFGKLAGPCQASMMRRDECVCAKCRQRRSEAALARFKTFKASLVPME